KTRAALSHHGIVDTKPTVLFPACAPSSWRLNPWVQKFPIGARIRRPRGEGKEGILTLGGLIRSPHRRGRGTWSEWYGRVPSQFFDDLLEIVGRCKVCGSMPPIKTVVTKVAEQECSAYVMRPPTFPISINPYIEVSFARIGDPNGWEYNVKKT